jgi:diaminopimelate decarboxylase
MKSSSRIEAILSSGDQNYQHSPLPMDLLRDLAQRLGTPFYFIDAEALRGRIAEILTLARSPLVQARYAMKALSNHRVLEEIAANQIWIDAVSGNEILRALKAGFKAGQRPPVILYSSDVFRDNGVEVILHHGILPNIGTEEMIDELADQGYAGGIGIRINPGFGHGFVKQCDTGGPSSKHGIWHEHLPQTAARARDRGLKVVLLHAHIGTGPAIVEFEANIRRLVQFFLEIIDAFPQVEAVNLGGGIPHTYQPGASRIRLEGCRDILTAAQKSFSDRAGRSIRVEIEPGRYYVAPSVSLITRVRGFKTTRANDKGSGYSFIMVDAGFNDLIRPAMYGSYHHLEVLGREGSPRRPMVVAGPLCESGDVFTRDDAALLVPRSLPRPDVGDLIAIRDAGAYGEAMSSNYNSIGKAPQVWYDAGKAFLVCRRQSLDDLLKNECFEAL